MSTEDQVEPLPPDVLVGMLAEALDDAMFRVHDTHRSHVYDDSDWTRCVASTLCREAAGLLARPEIQLAAAVREAS